MEFNVYSYLLLSIAVCYAAEYTEENGSRISGGSQASENQFPYAVSMQASDATSQALAWRGHRCGGVLITLQHVLTTATCVIQVNNDGTNTVVNAANFQIFGGSMTLSNSSADRVRPIANFTVHPQYIGSPAYVNDIAIVTLLAPFANTTVIPLALPSATYDPADFTLCTVAGWGATTNTVNAPMNTVLRYATKYVYNQGLCTQLYNNMAFVSNIHPTMLCATSYDILSTGCTGDEGNALVCNNTLTGLLFYHGSCSPNSYPELYTRINNYTTWIQSVTGSANSISFSPGLLTISLLTFFHIGLAKVVG